jgi:hypothetical protein
MMQRYMPLIFAVIYINIAAGVNIYFIVSSLCRIGIQEAIFRSGTLNKTKPAVEGVLVRLEVPARAKPRRRPLMERLADMQKQALEQKEAQQRARQALPPGDGDGGRKNSEPVPDRDLGSGAVLERRAEGPGEDPPKSCGTGVPKTNGQRTGSEGEGHQRRSQRCRRQEGDTSPLQG